MGSSQVAETVERGAGWADDPFLMALAARCSLTPRQLEALLLEAGSEEGVRLRFSERARRMGVSRGTYARILQQALNNVSQSLFTVLLLSYMDMLGERRHRWFIEIGEAVRDGRLDDALAILEEMQRLIKKRIQAVDG